MAVNLLKYNCRFFEILSSYDHLEVNRRQESPSYTPRYTGQFLNNVLERCSKQDVWLRPQYGVSPVIYYFAYAMKNKTKKIRISQGSTGSFGDLMNLKRFYDDSSVGSAENLVARAVPLSTVFCRQHHSAGSEESVSASTGTESTAGAAVPYHHRSRIELQQQQLHQHQQQQHQHQQQQQQLQQQQQQQQTRRYASELHGGCVARSAKQHLHQQHQMQHHHRAMDMTSQQRIERMSRIMKQQNHHRPEPMMRFRHTMTLVSPLVYFLTVFCCENLPR